MDQTKEISIIFKALSNLTRIEMLKEILNCPNCINGDMVNKFPLSQATVSQHLEVLVTAGLISIKRTGKKSICCVNSKNIHYQLNKIKMFAESLSEIIPENSSC